MNIYTIEECRAQLDVTHWQPREMIVSLLAHIDRLEAAQKLRPMDEAPSGGLVRAVVTLRRASNDRWLDENGMHWETCGFDGWLPCPTSEVE